MTTATREPMSEISARLIPCWITILFVSFVCLGCATAVSNTQETALESAFGISAAKILDHDAGTIVAGQPVAHVFRLKNDLTEACAAQKDEDIVRACGTATLDMDNRALAPGEETAVTVTTQTVGKNGRFTCGGKLLWTLASGEKRTTLLTVRGIAVPALCAEPSELVFTPEDVGEGRAKTIRFRGNVAIHWQTLTLSGSSGRIQIGQIMRSDRSASCEICCKLGDLEEITGYVVAQAKGDLPGRVPNKIDGMISVPIRASQTVDLTIIPTTATIRFTGTPSRASVRFLIRGKYLVGNDKPIQSVACQGYEVDWKLSRATSG